MTDSSGAAIGAADVRLINVARGEDLRVKTTAAGLYSVTGLIPGVYQLSVQAAGFRESVVAGLDVRIGESLRADVRLEIGNTSDRVEVSAEAAALNVDTSDIGTTVETKAILNLPLQVGVAVRDPLAFARLTPRFSGSTANSAVEYQTYYTINGSQSGSTQILVDGADVQLTGVQSQAATGIGVEAVEEFKVMASNFSAEIRKDNRRHHQPEPQIRH